jgi:DNA polymerase-3 subunit beta
MNITCSKNELFNQVQIVSRAVPNKTNLSILECILITAKDGQISLMANDMELGIKTYLDGTILEEGIIALNAKMLLEIVRKLPESEVSLETDEDFRTTILCEKAKFVIAGKEGNDFSYLPLVEKKNELVLRQHSLREAIRRTIFSISEGDRIMSGELLEIVDQKMMIASLDGHRISIKKIMLSDSYENRRVIIPGKALGEVARILNGEYDEMVTVYFTDKHVLFEFDQTTIVSRLIEGEYFQVEKMLYRDYETKVTIHRKDLLDCVERSTLLIREGDKKPIVMDIKNDSVYLSVNSVLGTLKEEISVEKEGKDLLIGFNPRFVLDVLRSIDDEKIDLYMLNSKSPCIIRDENESYTYLILPINFSTI